MVGLFEPVCAPWKVEGVPEDFSFGEIPPDWERMGPYVEKAMTPRARSRSRRACGSSSAAPRASPPISQPVVGESPELKNYFVAAGPELDRHPDRRRAGAACSRTGSSTAAPTSTSPA